jgi:hypothetical protein
MNEIEKIRLLADLEEEHCELNHGPDIHPENHPAADYITLPFGYNENSIKTVTVRELVIPVCFECAQALLHEEWTLLYCFACSHSRWVNRELAKNSYRHHILWLKGCPECTHTFGGLYFTDPRQRADTVEFVANHPNIRAA